MRFLRRAGRLTGSVVALSVGLGLPPGPALANATPAAPVSARVSPASAASLAAAAGAPAQVTELAGDGAWCWFQDARAVHFLGRHNRTYVGYVTSQGDIDVLALDSPTGTVYQTVLHPRLVADDHAAPAIEVLPDGRIAVFYAGHVGQAMYYRISLQREDISAFGPEQTVPVNVLGPYGYTYANPIYLPAEHRTYLFFRGGDARPVMTWSDDNLQTWSPAHTLVLPEGAQVGQRPYARYATNGVDTIYFAFDDGHPRDIPTNSVYSMSYRAGAFYRADGSRIASLASVTGADGSGGGAGIPISNTQADLVYAGNGSDGKAWVQDIAAGPDGRPVVVFASFPTDTNHRYHYAAWNGTSWQQADFAGGGGSIATIGDETEYSGGIELDHNDPSIFYTSRQSGAAWEIQRWQTPDHGVTFPAPVDVTQHSTDKNVRPVVPWGPPGPVKVLWMSGTYTHWKGLYDTSLQMLTTERAPTTSRVNSSAAAVPSNQKVTVSARAVLGFNGLPVPGLPASLYARPAGSTAFHRVARAVTNSRGIAAFHVQQKRATRYQVRFSSTSATTGSESPSLVVRQKVATVTRLTVSATSLDEGGRQQVTARLVDGDNNHPLAKQRVVIQLRSGHGDWQTFGRAYTDKNGLAHFGAPMVRSGYLRVIFPSQERLGGSASAAVPVTVNPISQVRISLDKVSVRSGGSALIQVRVVDPLTGVGLAHAPVTLWKQHDGDWSQVKDQLGTNAQGLAHWVVQPDGTTTYMVRADHVGARKPAASNPITLTVR